MHAFYSTYRTKQDTLPRKTIC